jgi:hypothetical protein
MHNQDRNRRATRAVGPKAQAIDGQGVTGHQNRDFRLHNSVGNGSENVVKTDERAGKMGSSSGKMTSVILQPVRAAEI